MKANIHLYPSDFSNESRIEKICSFLARSKIFDEIICIGTNGISSKGTIDRGLFTIKLLGPVNSNAGFILKILRFISWYFKVIQFTRKKKFKMHKCP